MPTVDGPDAQVEPPKELPIFAVPQSDRTSVTLDFTTPGPFGDFAFTARIPGADGTVRERVYGAYHTDEAAIFVEILQHWARVAQPDDILAGLDRADAVLRFLTDGLEPTARSENNFGDLLRRSIEPLAVMNFLPTAQEHSDERGGTIALSPRGSDLVWISPHTPRTTFSVPPSHLWVFVTGMMWRTYENDGIPLSRLNTAAYESAIATFWRAIGSCSQPQLQPELADGADGDETPMGTPELVQRLCELLGTMLLAYVGSERETRTVRQWADPDDARSPSEEVLDRLRITYRAVTLLADRDSAAVVQAWFQGRNLLLDDVAPARLLRDGEIDVVGPNVIAAARAFAASSENPGLQDPRHA